MNENLPEINFKEKKEKKGFLPWLRARLGFGSRGPMGGIEEAGGAFRGAANFGKLGAAKFGASSGIGGLLAGKAGLLVTAAIVAVGTGVYLANTGPSTTQSSSAFNGARAPDNYVPAILRSQAANQGSSLDMFKDTNKNAGFSLEEDAAKKAREKEAAAAPAEEQPADQNQSAPGDMAQDIMAKLQGADLTGSLGGGSSKFSNMGGFANKFGQGAVGPKVGFSGGVGSGFQGMPKFDQRKKMLAMKGSSRPVFSKAQGGKKGQYGKGSLNQAKGVKATQKSYSGTNIDAARSTQDKAWEGATGEEGAAATGAGISDGGGGLVTSPSLDNAGSGGGGGGVGTPDEPVIPTATTPEDVSPWKGLPQKAMMLLLLSAIISAIASAVAKIKPWGMIVACILAAVAIGLAVAAMFIGFQLTSSYGQTMLGMIYVIGGGCAIAAALMAIAGAFGMSALFNSMWMSAIAGILGLLGSMMGGK